MESMTQAHIYYSGIVQGVGFRYTVRRIAAELDVTGWVKNTSDGRVEILVEGLKDEVVKLCRTIDEYFVHNIQDKQVEYQEAEGKFENFDIIL